MATGQDAQPSQLLQEECQSKRQEEITPHLSEWSSSQIYKQQMRERARRRDGATSTGWSGYVLEIRRAGSAGGPGVQFGAFSTRDAASRMIATVQRATGVTPIIETAPNGLFRVRAYGMSEAAAQSLKTTATANGIDCYVFH